MRETSITGMLSDQLPYFILVQAPVGIRSARRIDSWEEDVVFAQRSAKDFCVYRDPVFDERVGVDGRLV